MKNKLQSWLNEYKEKAGKEYEGSRHPNPKATPNYVLHLVANIKIAEATICRNEIAEEIKNVKNLNDADAQLQLLEVNRFEDEIALWRIYVKA